MPKITKAVVAVAGTGTRFLPATKTMPKEMLPIIDKPIIQLVVEELISAGIKDIILVTKWDKKSLEDHFDHNHILNAELKKAGKLAKLNQITEFADSANFIYVRQKGPYGNGTPVLSASSILGDDPFMYVWGDDLVKSEIPFAKQMVDDYKRQEQLMIGVQKVPKNEVDRYGIVKLRQGNMEIEDIIEKPSLKHAPSQLADFGRMILNRDIINILKNTPLGKNNELWIVDAICTYVKNGGIFLAKEIENGEWLTTGDPLNYLKAVLKFAIQREDVGEELKKFIRNLILE
ncbi:MAG: UTP--glucose-1-phosphate uridylyltransferase [Desulfobacteraceae bacterium]|nr:UTP--glucose-1-phosphate uridylyltransferase [Desulfobacteraceae bacterium]